jgi:two-component system, NarL family, nitrate/nitrite response regulator NarL
MATATRVTRSSRPKKKAPAPKRIRILLADREEVFRLGIRQLFSLEDDLRVVAQATTGEQAISLAERFKPHLLLVQEEIAAEPPGNFMDQLRRISPPSKVVITASALVGDAPSRLMESGAANVIARSAALSHFVKCARQTMREKVSPIKAPPPVAVVKTVEFLQKPLARPVDTLTLREKHVIACLMQGFPNREISERLAIAEQTVKNHLRSIFDKVGVSDRLELVLYALHHKLELPLIETAQPQAPGTES